MRQWAWARRAIRSSSRGGRCGEVQQPQRMPALRAEQDPLQCLHCDLSEQGHRVRLGEIRKVKSKWQYAQDARFSARILKLVLKDGAISQVKNLCRKGHGHFQALFTERTKPMIDGQEVTLDQAISQGGGDFEERQEPSLLRLVQLHSGGPERWA